MKYNEDLGLPGAVVALLTEEEEGRVALCQPRPLTVNNFHRVSWTGVAAAELIVRQQER